MIQLPQQKEILDNLFSKYIRLKYTDYQGYTPCFTCGVKKPWKEMTNGHFIPRGYSMTRYDLRNCRPQCWGCNSFKQGRYDEFREALITELGEGVVKELEKTRNDEFLWDIVEIKNEIEFYKKLVNKMENGIM